MPNFVRLATLQEMGLAKATNIAFPDERLYWFMETMRRTPHLGDRRIHRCWVLRDGVIAVYEEDMGPWDDAVDRVSQVPCLWEYSLNEAREITDIGRGRGVPQDTEPIDLIKVWAKELDEKRMQAEHKSVFGAHHWRQRS